MSLPAHPQRLPHLCTFLVLLCAAIGCQEGLDDGSQESTGNVRLSLESLDVLHGDTVDVARISVGVENLSESNIQLDPRLFRVEKQAGLLSAGFWGGGANYCDAGLGLAPGGEHTCSLDFEVSVGDDLVALHFAFDETTGRTPIGAIVPPPDFGTCTVVDAGSIDDSPECLQCVVDAGSFGGQCFVEVCQACNGCSFNVFGPEDDSCECFSDYCDSECRADTALFSECIVEQCPCATAVVY